MMRAKRAAPLILLAGMMGAIVLVVFLPGQLYAPPPANGGSPQFPDGDLDATRDFEPDAAEAGDGTGIGSAPPVAPPSDDSQRIQTTITGVIDGDTVDVDGEIRIRLALVDTPERGEPGYSEAATFTGAVCAPGTGAAFDIDDGQKGGSYGRVIAEVWCEGAPGISLNELLLENGLAVIDSRFCAKSEFRLAEWAQNHGC